ncbi:uncharacterized protein LOC110036013 [Phalaenopsis equestris]|uniref:uncharacterized protein LOC110036013 n=1 Tax=Phalaenopsis equestris TaxID=78828 RepID=UPI0009E34613|nr:uncharacterized protein LOC110036013 [Phalaenopsis equestris]
MAYLAASFFALQPSFSSAPRFIPFRVIIKTGYPVASFELLNLNRTCQVRRSLLTSAASRPPPSQPSSGTNFFSGLRSMFARAEDGLRIFFAVLFWMSLFFWGSAWEGGDDGRKRGLRKRR